MSVPHIHSPFLAGSRHGFFTRRGGRSRGPYATLNCGDRQSDSPDCVIGNRRLVEQALDLAQGSLRLAHQSHSARVAIVESDSGRQNADALVTGERDLLVGILTADCLPILMAERQAGIVAATHAGWRGALAGIIENSVQAMVDLGAHRHRISAAIGPAISAKNYQVGDEFLAAFRREDSASAPFFVTDAQHRHFFDLPGYGLMRLRKQGLRQIGWCGLCTHGEPERFFSYRRSTQAKDTEFGLQLSVISA